MSDELDEERKQRERGDMEREEHLDAETIAEDAEELFRKKNDQPLLQPDGPPPEDG
jgi:hypothetical protein